MYIFAPVVSLNIIAYCSLVLCMLLGVCIPDKSLKAW